MKKFSLGLLFISALLTACSSSQKISSTDRARLATVVVTGTVNKPPTMYYMGPGAGVGFAFGAVGAAIAAGSQGGTGEGLRQIAEQNNVAIEKIVREESIQAFRRSGKLAVKETADTSAGTLSISITQYGFSVPNGFSSKVVPVMGVRYSLADASGKPVWSSTESLPVLGNPIGARSPDEFRSNPKLLEEVWRMAARAVSEKAVQKF
jgi:hypothetical protein